MRTRSERHRAGLFLAVLCFTGCGGPPQVAPENRRLVESVLTAVSARNPGWLDENVRLIEARRAAGGLSSAEDRALRAIVEKARGGDWAGAESDAFDLRDAQRATGADVRRLPEHARS